MPGRPHPASLAPLLKTALALLLLLTASCATPGKPANAKLIGRWRATNQSQTAEYTFANDSSFSGSVRMGGTTISKFTGKWSLANGAIAYEYTGDTLGRIPPGTKDQDRLLEVADAYFVIEAADGSHRRYERVHD